ncbi:MAG: YqgE/AlgH family protein, partial [Muribaculaceae bacterium]|nr:YqgE/AlgH family protein [Muribaculaceae bacterium]
VVLHHPSVSRLAALVDDCDVRADVPVYCGGPLALDRLFFMHTLGAELIPGARPYMPGMYIGGDFDAVLDYLNSGYAVEGRVRFFVGYSGWDEGQLESEIAEGTWALTESPADVSELLQGADDAFWHRAVRLLGDEFRSWRLVPRMACAN